MYVARAADLIHRRLRDSQRRLIVKRQAKPALSNARPQTGRPCRATLLSTSRPRRRIASRFHGPASVG
jgi:hypothetical protein